MGGGETLRLRVEGISCPGCAVDLETVLMRIDGVLDARVDYGAEKVEVEYEPGKVGKMQLMSVFRRMGMQATHV